MTKTNCNNLVLPPLTVLLVQNNLFASVKKIILHTLIEIIFRYHYIFLEFRDPLGPPYKQMKI